jgi:transposase
MSIRNHLVTADTKLKTNEYLMNVEPKKALTTSLKNIKNIQNDEISNWFNLSDKENEIHDSLERIRVSIKNTASQVNLEVKDFEKVVHKDIRTNAVKTCCEMYSSAISNLKNGNIKFFNISYKKKNSPSKCFGGISKSSVKFKDSGIQLFPGKFGKEILKISKKNYKKYKDTQIKNESKIILEKGNYFLVLTLPTKQSNLLKTERVCGLDPGLRSFLTVFDNEQITEINQNREYFKRLNQKIKSLKARRIRPRIEKVTIKRILRKRHYNKIEKKKIDYTNSIHWNTINYLLKNYDTILLGDIKSHGIVKNGTNTSNNQEFNDLKFYVFKQRLAFKAKLSNKCVRLVNEFNTTKCCSNCGVLNQFVGASEIFNCSKCGLSCGRDSNASKNIFLKGILL